MSIQKDNTQLQNARGSFKKGYKTLSVTFSDSSPRGRAKGLYPFIYYVGMKNRAYLFGVPRVYSLPLPLGEVAEPSEDGEGILPIPLGEVAMHSEDREGKLQKQKKEII